MATCTSRIRNYLIILNHLIVQYVYFNRVTSLGCDYDTTECAIYSAATLRCYDATTCIATSVFFTPRNAVLEMTLQHLGNVPRCKIEFLEVDKEFYYHFKCSFLYHHKYNPTVILQSSKPQMTSIHMYFKCMCKHVFFKY